MDTCKNLDTDFDIVKNLREGIQYENESQLDEAFWNKREENKEASLDIDLYDEFLADSGSVADAMGEAVQGDNRIEMAELIQQIEKTHGNTNYLLIQLGKLLVDSTTDELSKEVDRQEGK